MQIDLRGERVMDTASIDFTITLGNLAIVAALASIAVVLLAGLREIGKHVSIQTFSDYSQKYHEILARFPLEVWTTKNLTLASLSEAQMTELLSSYGDFFRLLANERHLRRIHFVDAKTWRLWSASSHRIMTLTVTKDAWARLRPRFSYDPKFQTFVDGLL